VADGYQAAMGDVPVSAADQVGEPGNDQKELPDSARSLGRATLIAWLRCRHLQCPFLPAGRRHRESEQPDRREDEMPHLLTQHPPFELREMITVPCGGRTLRMSTPG
jgi:hypothetical protein